MRKRQIQADGIRSVERPAVLPDDADTDTGADKFIHRHVMLLAEFFAVKIQHIGAFRFSQFYTGEVVEDITVGIFHIFRENMAKLIHPFVAFRLIGADKGMHGQNVHAVVVGELSLFPYPVTQIGVINNMIGANQAGQVEGFGRGINRDSPVSGIF